MRPGVRWPDMHLLAERALLGGLKSAGIVRGSIEEMLNKRLGAVFMPHGERGLCKALPVTWVPQNSAARLKAHCWDAASIFHLPGLAGCVTSGLSNCQAICHALHAPTSDLREHSPELWHVQACTSKIIRQAFPHRHHLQTCRNIAPF